MEKGFIRTGAPVLFSVVLLCTSAFAQMGPHVHGHGKVNIAIENDRVMMELIAPGADVVGFEHAPQTAEQKAAVEDAEATLKAPLELISLPAEAGCRVATSKVAVAGEEGHEREERETHGKSDHDSHARDGHKDDHDDHGKNEHKGHKESEHEGHAHAATHTEFRAEYMFLCRQPAAIRRIGFPYMKRFPRTEELEITVLSARGQKAFEVTPESPEITLE